MITIMWWFALGSNVKLSKLGHTSTLYMPTWFRTKAGQEIFPVYFYLRIPSSVVALAPAMPGESYARTKKCLLQNLGQLDYITELVLPFRHKEWKATSGVTMLTISQEGGSDIVSSSPIKRVTRALPSSSTGQCATRAQKSSILLRGYL